MGFFAALVVLFTPEERFWERFIELSKNRFSLEEEFEITLECFSP